MKNRKDLAHRLQSNFTKEEIAEIRKIFIVEFLTEKINIDPIKREWGIEGKGIARLRDVRDWVREVLTSLKLYNINTWMIDTEKKEDKENEI